MKLHTSTSTISDGNMSLRFGDASEVLGNRRTFLKKHNIYWENHVCMRCNHSECIVPVSKDTPVNEHRIVDAEVLITQTPEFTLALLTADCIPSVLFDPITKTLALAHFSRQTLVSELPRKTVEYLHTHFSIDPKNLVVQTGPYIHAASYTFPLPQPPLPQPIAAHTYTEAGHIHIDLATAHTTQLVATGVQEQNIQHAKTDTATSPEHYSHYATQKNNTPEGRILTIATITSS